MSDPAASADALPADLAPNLWRVRHRIIVGSLLFIAVAIEDAMHFVKSPEIASSVVTMGFTTGAGIIGSFVFGKVWETVKAQR